MSDRLKNIKERSKLRRQLLAQQLGASDANNIGQLLGSKDEVKSKGEPSDSKEKTSDTTGNAVKRTSSSFTSGTGVELPGIPLEKPPKVLVLDSQNSNNSGGSNLKEKTEEKESSDSDECEFDESVYKDSSAFLKGTQSANPHNDYCQNFLDTGQRPQNYIRDTDYAERFEEYPKLKELIRLKDEIISKRATPPMYLKADFETFDLRELNSKFDVILLDPPLEEYQRRAIGTSFNWKPWTWDEIMRLEIEEIAAQRSFIFMWCGSHEGLYLGRKCLKKWGFRRCEDICWIKTNKNNPGPTKYLEPDAIFQHTKEHCLMGIKGTVRRSTDGDFIHANVDIDLIITEEAPYGSTDKPIEIFHIIEHFCLGRRRLNLFGSDSTLRPGWLTVGPDLSSSNFNSETYNAYFSNGPDDYLVGNTPEIETLRPKSPVAKNKDGSNRGRGGPGRGRGGQGQSNRGGINKGIRGGMSGRAMSRGGGGGFPGRGMHRGGFQQS